MILVTKGKNLHSLWDGLLGRDSRMSGVAKAVAELSDRERFGNVWDLSAQETDPIEWAKESHDLAEAVVYDDVDSKCRAQFAAGREDDAS